MLSNSNIKIINRASYLIMIFSLIIIIASSIYYIAVNYFPITKITISGDIPHITQSQATYIANNKLIGSFFTLDINKLQTEFHKIPWVKSVSIVRSFPNQITVYIVEHQAVARWGDRGLLSSDGIIFNGADDNIELPTIIASKSQAENVFIVYNSILNELNTFNAFKVQKLLYEGTELIKIYLIKTLFLPSVNPTNNTNFELIICGPDFIKNLKTFNKNLDKLYQIKPNMVYANMCYKNALAIK